MLQAFAYQVEWASEGLRWDPTFATVWQQPLAKDPIAEPVEVAHAGQGRAHKQWELQAERYEPADSAHAPAQAAPADWGEPHPEVLLPRSSQPTSGCEDASSERGLQLNAPTSPGNPQHG